MLQIVGSKKSRQKIAETSKKDEIIFFGSDTERVDELKKTDGLREALASCILLVGVPPTLVWKPTNITHKAEPCASGGDLFINI